MTESATASAAGTSKSSGVAYKLREFVRYIPAEADEASAAEQLSAMSQATAEAGSLADQAEQLQRLRRKFEVGDDGQSE